MPENTNEMFLKVRRIVFCVAAAGALGASAQLVQSNPLEYAALVEGNEIINKEINVQIKGQTETAALQATIATEFTKIHDWEKQYNSYLKDASRYASTLKASTSLYNEGFRIFLTLSKLYGAIKDNPQGIVATVSMNNLYVETATEMASVYTLLKNAIANGGVKNMLNGAERSQTLWALNDRLADFHRKLKRLAMSIRCYTLNDVWQNVTAGMIDRDISEIARSSKRRWKAAYSTVK